MITVEIDNLKAENFIKSQEEFNKTVLSSLNAQIAVLNDSGKIVAVNRSWESFARENQSYPSINYSLGSNLTGLYEHHPSNKMLQQIGEGVEGVISGYIEDWDVEHFYETSIGECWYLIKLTPMGKKYGGAILSRVDITELKESKERYNHLVYHDSLTGLSNRLGFQDQFHQALERIDPGDTVALMFIDLDRFKFINDALGHTIGDKVLKEIAERLKQCQLEDKILSRWGGDEFTILFPKVKDVHGVTEVAENILKSLSKAYQVEGYEFFLSASIGIAFYPEAGEDVETLLMNADKAMFYAKEQGKNNYHIYHKSMTGPSLEELEMETDLHHALESHEFFLYYQPQFVLGTNKMTGVEALIRWKRLGRLVPPDRFIPMVEANGLITEIGRWVLYTACAQNKLWQDAGHSPMVMAVNVSAQQFQKKNFLNDLDHILSETGLDPKYLELEITERLLMHHEEAVIDKLIHLRAKGIKISIDDFGTGYSSLSYLKQFPINKLKIDQSFVRNLTKSSEDTAITTAIIAMGHSLDLKVVAEGIEDQDQLDFLHKNHCDEGQGYYFSRPLSVQDFSLQLSHLPFPL